MIVLLTSQADAPDPGDGSPSQGPIDAFSPSVVAAEYLLKNGELQTLPAEEAWLYEFPLKIRSLALTGPMTPEEMHRTQALLQEYRSQIQAESNPLSRETLRNHRNRILFEALPRLDPVEGARALDEIRQAYQEAFPD